MAARVLSDKLPIDIAEYIARIAACTHIQTVTRSMLARQPRRPRDGAGFEHIEPWEYRSTGESFATRIESWCQTHYRPGVYVLAVTATHTDQPDQYQSGVDIIRKMKWLEVEYKDFSSWRGFEYFKNWRTLL